MNIDNKIMSRIRKLLAMSEASESPQEAQIAAAKAHAMLKEYNLTAIDVELNDSEVKEITFETGAGTLPYWITLLATTVGNALNCSSYTQSDYVKSHAWDYKRVRNIIFVGIDTDVEVANYLFGYMFRYLKTALKKVKGRNAKNEFATGFSIGLAERLEKEFPTPSEMKAKEGALVIAKEAKIQEYITENWGKVGRAVDKKVPEASQAMKDGINDAKTCSLYQAMRPQDEEQLSIK